MRGYRLISIANTRLILIIISFILLIYPAMHLKKSMDYLENSTELEAVISSYDPEMNPRAGGMMEIMEYYTVQYNGHKKKLLFGVKTLKMKEMRKGKAVRPEHMPGDKVALFHKKGGPDTALLKRGQNMLFKIYNEHENIALLYLLIIISAALTIIVIITQVKHSLSSKVTRQ